ncbi:unnamed protein product [Owenia fusiformis]|uniref:Uncharacterized protein n=1 Tax=Owenia fusiformis TaxID=6347 RepID=A0A8J1XZ15_OWEFU|nr:unnamed protein product [Owenia fusiformis]
MEYIEPYDDDVKPISEPLASSYINVISEKEELDAETFLQHLQKQKENDNDAFVFLDSEGNRRDVLTFRGWNESSQDMAVSLLSIGVKSGDFVGIISPNCRELIITFGALLHINAIPVLLTFDLKSGKDVAKKIRDCNIKTVMVEMCGDSKKREIVDELFGKVLRGERDETMPDLKHVLIVAENVPPGAIDVATLMKEKSESERQTVQGLADCVTKDSPVFVLLTSGSTGDPKYCLVPHRAHINISKNIKERSRLTEGKRYFNDRPFSWAGGVTAISSALVGPCTVVTIDARYTVAKSSAEMVLKILEQETISHAVVLPYLMYDIDKLERANCHLPSWECTFTGGQRVDADMVERYKVKTKTGVMTIYGATECGFASSLFPFASFTKQYGTVGYPFPHNEISIRDINSNDVLPSNTQGEICVRGPLVFLGYLNNKEATREALQEDGWYHTGDIGSLTPYGYIIVAGRLKEFIKRGTTILQPLEIERVLLEHPGIHQVQAVGVPDPRLFEEVCACILPESGMTLTIDDIKAWCDGLYDSKVSADGLGSRPKYFIILEEFPLLSNGKVDRVTLKMNAAKSLGLD